MRALAFAIALSFVPALAAAQDKRDDCVEDATQLKSEDLEYVDGVWQIKKKMVICGKPPKPMVLSMRRTKFLNYEWEKQKPNFLKKVHESLAESPF